MNVKNIVNYFDGYIKSEFSYDAIVCGATLDSRKTDVGDIFFACVGEYTNGNTYAQSAINEGAAVVVMDDVAEYEKVKGNKILVKDTIVALKQMGHRRLMELEIPKVMVTGSFGKTSTKEMVRLILSNMYNVAATKGNHNNELGVLLTACGIPEDTEIAVFEAGSNSRGEIAHLTEIINPNVILLTSLGHAHVGKFGSFDEVANEKLDAVLYSSEHALIIANEVFDKSIESLGKQAITFGRSDMADLQLTDCMMDGHQLRFTMSTNAGDFPITLNYPYLHLAENYIGAAVVGRVFDIPFFDMAKSALEYIIPEGRGNIIKHNDLTVINDSYNASLESILKGIDSLALMEEVPKYALIGGVGEIEGFEDYVAKALLEKAENTPHVQFIFASEEYAGYEEIKNVIVVLSEEEIVKSIKDITSGVILIKASRAYEFERYVEMILENAEVMNVI